MREIAIGAKELFRQNPAEVVVERNYYFLFEEEGVYRLMSRECPHAGYTVELEDGELVCPLHGWTFEKHSGRCHHVPNARLDTFEIVEREGTLYVQMA